MEHYDTNQMAKLLKRQAQTLRVYYNKTGSAYGITPVRIGSRLYWPKDQVRRVSKGLPAVAQTQEETA